MAAGRVPRAFLYEGRFAISQAGLTGPNRWPEPLVSLGRCASCDILTHRTKTCGRCGVVHYCSKMCQAVDWHTGGHKHLCQPVRAPQPPAPPPPPAAPVHVPQPPPAFNPAHAVETVRPAPAPGARSGARPGGRARLRAAPAPHFDTMDELRERARLREEQEKAAERAAELEKRRDVAAQRLAKMTAPAAAFTATMPQRGSSARPRSRGRSRGTENELVHQEYTSPEAKARRQAYGTLKQAVEHLEAEARKARERADALLQDRDRDGQGGGGRDAPRAPGAQDRPGGAGGRGVGSACPDCSCACRE